MRSPPDSYGVLELLGTHHDFMESIKNVAVIGDSYGDYASWWSDYRCNDEQTKSHYVIKNFVRKNQCRGHNKRPNIRFIETDFSNTGAGNETFDVIWASNCFQQSADPYGTLQHWWNILRTDGMLCLSVPQATYFDDLGRLQINSYSGEYSGWNIVNLIQALATCGFDCRDGHFKQTKNDPYIWASVYKGTVSPQDPATTSWYTLKELNLTPVSLDECIDCYGYVRHDHLMVEWLDHTVYDIAAESRP